MITPSVDIIRMENSFAGGALGALRIGKKLFCATLEPATQDNIPNHSCIPPGQYVCKRYYSKKFGDTFEVKNVPNRTYILFHPGNTIHDTNGCIILGITWGQLAGDRAVLNSGKTFDLFMEQFNGLDKFILTIKEDY